MTGLYCTPEIIRQRFDVVTHGQFLNVAQTGEVTLPMKEAKLFNGIRFKNF